MRCNYKQGGSRISKFFFSPEESKSKILRGYCGVIESSDIYPLFVRGLRPIPRPIIAYEEDNGDHGSLGNRAEDSCSRLAKAKVEEK